VGRELASFAIVQGTKVRVGSFTINSEYVFSAFDKPQSHTIDDLPQGTSTVVSTLLDIERLAPSMKSEADLVTCRIAGSDLQFELWRMAARPGF
jgi:hypothetical protein